MPEITEADIALLVERFYGRIRAHPMLGPVFHAAIGEEEAAWDRHLARLRQFWSSVMLRSGAFHGDPYSVHLRLPGLTPAMFAEWLALFDTTCAELFAEPVAAAFRDRAQRIARSLQMGIFTRLPPVRATAG
jgi:hemoglobin